jgi:hypothetical protein
MNLCSMKALLLAQTLDRSLPILQATIGVVFQGTPHRGASTANLGKTAADILSCFGVKTTTKHLDLLRLGSPELDALCSEFSRFLPRHPIRIATFYESLSIKIGPATKLVR